MLNWQTCGVAAKYLRETKQGLQCVSVRPRVSCCYLAPLTPAINGHTKLAMTLRSEPVLFHYYYYYTQQQQGLSIIKDKII